MGGWHSRSRRTSYDRRFYEGLLAGYDRRRVFCLNRAEAAAQISQPLGAPAAIRFNGPVEGCSYGEKDGLAENR